MRSRHSTLARWLSAAVALAPVTSGRAAALLDVELGVGGGTDTGLFRLALDLPPRAESRDTFVAIRPHIGAELHGADQGVQLGYDGSYRDFSNPHNGEAMGHLVVAQYALALGEVTWLEVALSGAIEQLSAVPGDYRAAVATLGPTWRPSTRWRVGVAAEGQHLEGEDNGPRSTLGGAVAHALWREEELEVGAAARWRSDRDADPQLSGQVHGALRTRTVSLYADAGAGWLRQGTWLAWGAAVQLPLGPSLALEARYRGSVEDYVSETAELVAHEGLLVVAYHWESEPAEGEVILRRARSMSQEAVQSTRVRLLCATEPAVREVTWLSELDGWRGAGRPLRRVEATTWELVMLLPAGRYAYQVRVDGVLVAPKGAGATAPDAFGGRNAVLVVDGAAQLEERLTCTP